MKETLSRVFVCFVNEKLLKSKPCCIYESTFQELEKQDKTHRFSYQYNFFFHLLCTSLACSPLDLTRVCVSRCCNIAYTIFQLAYNYYSTLSYLFSTDAPLYATIKTGFHVSFLEFCFIHFCYCEQFKHISHAATRVSVLRKKNR